MKKCSIVLAAMLAALSLTACAPENAAPEMPVTEAPAVVDVPDEDVPSQFSFEFDEPYASLDMENTFPKHLATLLHYIPDSLNLFNNNITASGVVDETNSDLAFFALTLLNHEVDEARYQFILDADELRTFMSEAFGLDLPFSDAGKCTYYADENKFGLPLGEPGFNTFVVAPLSFESNPNGTITMQADLLVTNYGNDSLADLNLNAREIPYGVAATLTVTCDYNEDYTVLPLKVVSITHDTYDWNAAQGEYVLVRSADGFTLSLEIIELEWGYEKMAATFTNSTNESDIVVAEGFMLGNMISLSNYDIELNAFITLNPNDTVTIQVESGPDIEGHYAKISE